MTERRHRTTASKTKAPVTGAPTKAEVKRLAKFARSMLPRGVVRDLPRARGKRGPSDATILIEGAFLVGAAAMKVMGNWCEIGVRVMAMALADGTRGEELRRALTIWAAVSKLGEAKRKKIKSRAALGTPSGHQHSPSLGVAPGG